jgi:flavin-dependent dehydrogenase
MCARARDARRHDRFVGTGTLPNHLRASHGAGWALVGDASYHKDPATAQGMSDAMSHGEALAEAIHEALEGTRGVDEALEGWAHSRAERLRSMFDWTCRVAEMPAISPRTRALLAAVAADPGHTARMLGVYAETVPHEQFFAPDNIARIVERSRDG